MIRSLRFLNRYPSRLPGIRTRQLDFGPRFNLLFGPNGSGKSTILKTIALKTGSFPGGWSDGRAPIDPEYGVEMEWDGLPVFYEDCQTQSDHPLIDPEFFLKHKVLRSTGEKRIGLINELVDEIEGRFPLYRLKLEDYPTLLLDEVDNHIGFAGQAILWKDLIPTLARKYQIIVSSHSIFPVLLKKQNGLRDDVIFQLHPGYLDACIAELANAIDFFNDNER